MSGHTSTAGRRALRGMHEVGIAGAVGRLDLDLRLGDLGGVGSARQQRHQAGAEGQGAEFAPRHPALQLVRHHVIHRVVVTHVSVSANLLLR